MKQLKVLIACEESQRVCIEFRKLGHEAYPGVAENMAQQWSAYLTGQADKQLSFFEED